LRRQIPTILRLFWVYQPLKTFTIVATAFLIPGMILGLRFLYFYIFGTGAGHIQSLILAAVLLIVGFQMLILGMVADLLAANRRLMEDTLYRVRKIELMSLSQVNVERTACEIAEAEGEAEQVRIGVEERG
jgi:hypothetical protein